MAKVLSFDEFMNESESYGFVSSSSEVEELFYDEAAELSESEIDAFLGISKENIYEAASAKEKSDAFKYVKSPDSLKKIKNVLKKGSKGEEVKILQSQMGVVIDEIFGPETQGGLKKWQEISGIKVDGIFRPEDAEKYIKTIKKANVPVATKEARKIAHTILDPTNKIVLKGIDSVTIIKIDGKTYIIITPSKDIKTVSEEAKKKNVSGWEFLKYMGTAGGPMILFGEQLFKISKEVFSGMLGALYTIGKASYEVSINAWSGLLKIGEYIKKKGKQSLIGIKEAGIELFKGFTESCAKIAKSVKESGIALGNLFVYLYNEASKSFKKMTDYRDKVLKSIFSEISIAGKKLGSDLKAAYNTTVNFVKSSLAKAKEIAKNGFDAISAGIQKTKEAAIKKAKQIDKAAEDFCERIGKKASKFFEYQYKSFASLFESQNEFGEKSIFENYNTLIDGTNFYVPLWKFTINE